MNVVFSDKNIKLLRLGWINFPDLLVCKLVEEKKKNNRFFGGVNSMLWNVFQVQLFDFQPTETRPYFICLEFVILFRQKKYINLYNFEYRAGRDKFPTVVLIWFTKFISSCEHLRNYALQKIY